MRLKAGQTHYKKPFFELLNARVVKDGYEIALFHVCNADMLLMAYGTKEKPKPMIQGVPAYLSRFGKEIMFYPCPDKAYKVSIRATQVIEL